MSVNLCGPLQHADDDDSTYFLRFLKIQDKDDGRKSAVIPMAGFLAGSGRHIGQFGKKEPPGKLEAADLGKLVSDARAALQKGNKGAPLAFNTAFSRLNRQLAGGKLWTDRLLAIGGVHWLVGLQYKQNWRRTSVGAGRLLATVPVGLYPATKRVDVKIWNKTVESSRTAETGETLYTTDISSNDRWSLATKKLFAKETASEINPAATLNSIGISVPGKVGVNASGALGISGSFTNNVTDQVDTQSELISDFTEKSATSLKSSRTVEVSVSKEGGIERTVTETLHNPNRGATLNYLYWEILETYEVATGLDDVGLYLSVPLPIEKVTPEWLLQHECAITPRLPCDTLKAGFEAVKLSLKLERQAQLLEAQIGKPDKQTAAITKAGDSLVADLTAAIAVIDELMGANPANGKIGAWEYWSLVGIVAGNDLKRGLETLKAEHAGLGVNVAPDDASDIVGQALTIVGPLDDVFSRMTAAVASLMGFSALFGCAIIPPLGVAVVVLITALAVSLEAIGIDLIPDDEGLEKALRKLKASRDAYRDSLAAPPQPMSGATAGFDPVLRAGLMREQLLNRKIEADIELNRLAAHVRDEIYKYHHAIWAEWSSGRIAQALLQAGVPPALAESRFITFELDRAIVRVANVAEVEDKGLKWRDFANEVLAKAKAPAKRTLLLPAPGVWAEAARGACDALDGFVSEQRRIDLRMKEALLAQQEARSEQEEAETQRLKDRLAAGELGDPSPYKRVDSIDVKVKAEVAAELSDNDG
jgi:hypothetical protein